LRGFVVFQRDIKEVIEILRQKSDASDLILTGLVLMRYLAQRVENQKKIASARGVSLVLHALQTHDSNPTLQVSNSIAITVCLQNPSYLSDIGSGCRLWYPGKPSARRI
jgi:hypothetical protein